MITIIILFISFIALLWSANHLIVGTSALAYRFQIPPIILGLTIIALGTSLPELFFSIMSSLKDEDTSTVSSIIGSNIANIGLVLGITILIKPNTFHHNNFKKTYPLLIIIMLFVYSLIIDGYLGRIDGCLFLIACLVIISTYIYTTYKGTSNDLNYTRFKKAVATTQSLKTSITSVILGLVILPISSRHIVLNATDMANWFHINQLTLGLTIQAIGTTLPELSTALIAALKGEEDLAVGTILGSNIYNLLLVLAFPALINPGQVNSLVLWRDIPVMLFLAVFLVFLNYSYKKNLSAWHGGVLLLIYACYIFSTFLKAPISI